MMHSIAPILERLRTLIEAPPAAIPAAPRPLDWLEGEQQDIGLEVLRRATATSRSVFNEWIMAANQGRLLFPFADRLYRVTFGAAIDDIERVAKERADDVVLPRSWPKAVLVFDDGPKWVGIFWQKVGRLRPEMIEGLLPVADWGWKRSGVIFRP